ncbi:hypothetical protein AU193_01385 [Mycobacterium sp. GA-1285]|uniref:hypothetical protein n=1 Tax=Mycobacterium sp. GA-1285 TaxID=1772282 RepID=UPI000747D9B1|nr:hypothetical protein [Mycobacterium sp. GA-1285]KUI23429.1 hypothetical protein AU193_01385 [Mycobacterium sp. GA-1285]
MDFAERYPWAVGVFAVPLTIIGLAGVALYPYFFVPLLLLGTAALILVEVWAGRQEEAEHQAQVAAERRAHHDPSSPGWRSDERVRAEAAEARARAAQLWAQAEAAEARAQAAEARAQAVEARAQATRRQHGEADTEEFPRPNYP